MSRRRPKQRRNAARRPWRRPLVGLGLLAGWLAVSTRGRQAVKVAKEQAGKARQTLAAARPARTTTVAPPTGAPPGPVLAEVRLNRPRTGSAAAPGPGRRGAAGTARVGAGLGGATGQGPRGAARQRLGFDAPTVWAVAATGRCRWGRARSLAAARPARAFRAVAAQRS